MMEMSSHHLKPLLQLGWHLAMEIGLVGVLQLYLTPLHLLMHPLYLGLPMELVYHQVHLVGRQTSGVLITRECQQMSITKPSGSRSLVTGQTLKTLVRHLGSLMAFGE